MLTERGWPFFNPFNYLLSAVYQALQREMTAKVTWWSPLYKRVQGNKEQKMHDQYCNEPTAGDGGVGVCVWGGGDQLVVAVPGPSPGRPMGSVLQRREWSWGLSSCPSTSRGMEMWKGPGWWAGRDLGVEDKAGARSWCLTRYASNHTSSVNLFPRWDDRRWRASRSSPAF